MIKYFLILLLSVTGIFCAHSQVVIPDKVAAFYLEKFEENVFLKNLDTINRMRAKNLSEIMVKKDSMILSYRQDSVKYEEIILAKDTILLNTESDLKSAIKTANHRTFQRDLCMGVTAGVLIGTPFGQPIIGAIVGGATILVTRLVKRKRHNDDIIQE